MPALQAGSRGRLPGEVAVHLFTPQMFPGKVSCWELLGVLETAGNTTDKIPFPQGASIPRSRNGQEILRTRYVTCPVVLNFKKGS